MTLEVIHQPAKTSCMDRRAFLTLVGAVVCTGRPRLSRAQSSVDPAFLFSEIERIKRTGKGVIELPAGNIVVRPPEGKAVAVLIPHGTELRGAGRDQTRILMAPGSDGHVLNAPEGGLRLFDLTVDGQSHLRPGRRGHNIRFEGEGNVIERVNCINACSYGIGLGQRRYAKALIKDVRIFNAGADGVDCKNNIGRTEVTFENITVQQVGTAPHARNSAAIDLRGRCSVAVATIRDVGLRDGLRFRHGEHGEKNGAGAHGSRARNVAIQGAGAAFAVVARDVEIADFQVDRASFGAVVGAKGLRVSRGFFSDCIGVARYKERESSARFEHVSFNGQAWRADFAGGLAFEFIDCEFSQCVDLKSAAVLRARIMQPCP